MGVDVLVLDRLDEAGEGKFIYGVFKFLLACADSRYCETGK